ncbi:MAG: alpha/beta fold hydrolase [bacterium]|nr:alpha/beta fold hydrolase [bacterium]
MPTPIVMPKLGMSMQEGTVIAWPIALGGRVEKGEIVLTIESEKAEVEIEATDSGFFRHVYVEVDEVVPCGTLLGALTESADEEFDVEAFLASRAVPTSKVPLAGAEDLARDTAPRRPVQTRAGPTATPAARRMARERDLDLDEIPGSGPNGRITREDVEAYSERRELLVEATGGICLEVPTQGPEDGEPVLLLPGFGSDVSAFAHQIPALAEEYRVRGVNPRGVGLSDAPEAECYRVADAANDAAALSEAPSHVIGTSLGAAAALELALEQPERVRSLTLIAPLVRAEARLLAVLDAWCELSAQLPPSSLALALLPFLFSNAFLADATRRKRILRGLSQSVARVPVASLERWAGGLREWSGSRENQLAEISVPTLVLVAGEDLLTPGGEAVAAAIPGAQCVIVPDTGHALMLEAPDVLNEALFAHLHAIDEREE